MKYSIMFCMLLMSMPCKILSKIYYVNNQHAKASNSNSGSIDLPLLTIQAAADKASQPGDIVYVQYGLYDEQVTCNYSGNTSGGYICFVGYPGDRQPVMRGFYIRGKQYIKVIGFEITHNSALYSCGVNLYGKEIICDHIEILDNYIHDVVSHGIRWIQSKNTKIIVRGNKVYMAGCPKGVAGGCTGNGLAVQANGYGFNLIEYNEGKRCGDFVNVNEIKTIVRNNYLYDFRNDYWPDGAGDGLHCDMFQPCGLVDYPSNYQVYEANMLGDNLEINSHALQMQSYDLEGINDHHIIFRGNVAYNFGSYAMGCQGIDYVYYYNNTITNVGMVTTWNMPAVSYSAYGTDPATNNFNFNNIYSIVGNLIKTGPPIAVFDTGSNCVSSNNVCYKTSDHSSIVKMGDPKLASDKNYSLQEGSIAIDCGKPITTVTSTKGNGKVFNVAESGFFCDGFGIADGDIIRIGQNPPVKITEIAGKSITVDRNVSWNTGDGVFWRNQDDKPDAGAFEYLTSGYDFKISIDNPAMGDTILDSSITITSVVTNSALIRFVMYYVNGIPQDKMFSAPFQHTFKANDKTGKMFYVVVKAYGLYASKEMVKSDTVSFYMEPPVKGRPGGFKINR